MLNNLMALVTSRPCLTVVVIVLVLDAIGLLVGLLTNSKWLVKDADGKKVPSSITIAHVIAWTIVPPAWFFLETYTLDAHLLPSAKHADESALKAAYDSLRLSQELAKNFWAAILAAILFLVPKK